LDRPTGVAFDGTGNIYIADSLNHRIRKAALATGVISTFAGTGTAGFDGDGGAATSASLNQPTTIAFDGSGNLYITDSVNNRVRKVLIATGVISTIAGNGSATFGGDGGPATSASLNSPMGVVVDGAGNVFVADYTNHRVRKIDSSGVITTIAGNGATGFSGDGAAAPLAALYYPSSVALDANGTLYIGDSYNNRVRMVAQIAAMAPVITSAAPGGGALGVAYSSTYRATGFPVPTFSVTAGGLPSGLSLSASGTISGTATAAGTFTGTVTASNGIAPAGTQNFSITIAKASQAISFASLPTRNFGESPFGVSAIGGGSSSPVTFSSLTSAVCITGGANGSTVTLVASGGCTIAANQAGDSNYNAANQVLQSFSVGKASQGIAFGALAARTLGDPPFQLSATGGGSGNPVTFASTATAICTTGGTNGTTVTLVATGTCTIAANQAGNANYNAASQVTQSFVVGRPPGGPSIATSASHTRGAATIVASSARDAPSADQIRWR
jgi:hypothetical protein